MEWAIGIAAILAVGYFILGKLANSNNLKIQEMVEAGRQIREGEREVGETINQARNRKHGEAAYRHYEKISDEVSFVNFLDEQCEGLFKDWETGENGDTLDTLIPKIQARL